MPHAFISYKHEDLAFAQDLSTFAQRMGVPIWLDTHIQPGEEWRGAIDKAITEAFAVVVIMTPEAQRSEYITYEWAFAMGLRIPVIPVLLRPTKLHPKLEVVQYLDFTRGASMQIWITLIERLRAVQSAQPPRPAQQQPVTPGGPAPYGQPPPATMEEEIRQSVINFFTSDRNIHQPSLVFGLAKDIVRQLEEKKGMFESVQGQEKRVFESVQAKINQFKSYGSHNYNQGVSLEYAVALVKGLGLSAATHSTNQVFLLLGMPAIPKEQG